MSEYQRTLPCCYQLPGSQFFRYKFIRIALIVTRTFIKNVRYLIDGMSITALLFGIIDLKPVSIGILEPYLFHAVHTAGDRIFFARDILK
jgi:hypothetical protein